MVREWDPRTASSGELQSLLDTLNAAVAADLPDDPLWQDSSLREYLSETMPGERRISWIAEEKPDADGSPTRIVGYVNVLLLGEIGVVELLVHPAVRRRGLGRRLLGIAARRVYHEGFTALGVEVIGGTPAVAFYDANGFNREYVEIRSVLRLSAVDWLALGEMARGVAAGYRIEFHPGGPTDPQMIEAYARAKAELRDVEDGDLDLRPSSYDPERLRESLACLHRRGMKPYIVLAIHEQTGEVAGLTEVVVPAQHPTRADQYDTIVAQGHRSYGIDRAIKARMLFELRAAEPKLAEVQTWNAQANESMLKVNAELGFEPDRDWWEFGADVADIAHRLEAEH
ncbi:Ribosomal protein S18 acetylase RimI [Micromonospora pattaloongensis]|uniref:Ribosomal protein S18 acetylase RimI n=1 Tax=Micromonospora pattaloongensis TaxID=405436 RepID=A0A1H3GRR6_9ACTN|nr:GNAT family N-acetyltransferase [Micromonospora pattaloongensis]SDY06013.1 Ribosomal protein S18 acetylase RimI [Micromonospora pattaloongensis]